MSATSPERKKTSTATSRRGPVWQVGLLLGCGAEREGHRLLVMLLGVDARTDRESLKEKSMGISTRLFEVPYRLSLRT
jgi:hypothetical protein